MDIARNVKPVKYINKKKINNLAFKKLLIIEINILTE